MTQGLPGISGSASLGSLPQAGNLSAQLAQAQSVYQAALAAGDPTSVSNLLSAGVTLAQDVPGTPGVVVRDILTIAAATAAGLAAGGPWGAVAGAIASSLEVALDAIFGGGPPDQVTYSDGGGMPTKGTQQGYKLLSQWGTMTGHVGSETGNPLGWTLYDYLAQAYPPASATKDAAGPSIDAIWACVQANFAASGVTTSALIPYGDNNGPGDFGNSPGVNMTALFAGKSLPNGLSGAEGYFSIAQPLCTPVIWDWAQPSNIQDCTRNQWMASSTAAHLRSLWQNDSDGLGYPSSAEPQDGPHLTVAQIMGLAEKNRPPSAFFCSDLYVTQNGNDQVFGNCAALVMLGTWLGLAAFGAHPKAIFNELNLQQKFLNDLDGSVPTLCRLIVESALALATAAEGASAGSSAAQTSVSNWVNHYLGH